MTRTDQDKKFNALLAEMSAIRKAKNSDYGSDEDSLSNLRECESMGIPAWVGTIIRIGDKWSRLKQLTKKGKAAVKNESIIDTLLDTANYCLLTIILLEERKKKEPRVKWVSSFKTGSDFYGTRDKKNE